LKIFLKKNKEGKKAVKYIETRTSPT